MRQATRQTRLFITCLLCGLMLLTSACVLPPTPVSSTDNGTPTATTPAAAEQRASHTITDAAGHTVEIPVDPQRIVVVDYNAVEELLALEVMPVGILYGAPDFLADALGRNGSTI